MTPSDPTDPNSPPPSPIALTPATFGSRPGVATRLDVRELPVPAMIADAGEHAGRRFLEFFTVNIRNPNTREAYARACGQFLTWCEERGFELDTVEPMVVAAYVEQLTKERAPQTVKQLISDN